MSYWYKRSCSAPSCRCESPCDAYYEDHYPEDEPRWEDCAHCGKEAWPEDAKDHEKICEHCGIGAQIETLFSSATHRARKEHPGILGDYTRKSITIYPGDIYERIVVGGYEVGGARWLSVTRRLIRRATDIEKLAVLKHEKEH